MSHTVISFGRDTVETVFREITGEPLIEGQPQQSIQNYYSNHGQQYSSGIWTSTKGKWHAFSGRSEFCYILEGVVRLTERSGRSMTYQVGDSFQITPEFDGTWEVLEDAKKLYVIFEPK